MTTTPDAKTVVRRYIAAVEAGDDWRLREIFAEDATWQLGGELPISGTWRGRDGSSTSSSARPSATTSPDRWPST